MKKSNEIEIKYFKILIQTYKYEESQNNINYNVIQNLKNGEEIFKKIISKIYESIFREGKNYISFLKNIQSISYTNSFKNNFFFKWLYIKYIQKRYFWTSIIN